MVDSLSALVARATVSAQPQGCTLFTLSSLAEQELPAERCAAAVLFCIADCLTACLTVAAAVAAMSVSSELSALLSQSDPHKVLSSVDALCRSLAGKPYLLSSSFYPSFGLLLHRLLSVSFQGSVPPLVCSVPRAWELLRPSGSLFALLFLHTSFPPKYALPVSLLPPQCRQFVHSLAASSSASASSSSSFASPLSHPSASSTTPLPGCPGVVPLLRSSYQASSDCLQLSIHDYLFFSLALFLTRDLPAATKLSSNAYQPHGPAATAGVSAATQYQLNVDECYRCYQSVVQHYLAFFLPASNATAAATAAGSTTGGTTVANRSLHGSSLAAILAEVWVGEAASAAASSPHVGSSSSLTGLHSLTPSLPSPFVSASSAPPSVAHTHSSSPSSVGFSFPSPRVLGCVRSMVLHLLSAPAASSTKAAKSSTSASTPAARSSSTPSVSAWALSVSSVDVCLFRFLRSCLLHPPSQYDERLHLVITVWLSLLSAAAAHPSQPPQPPPAPTTSSSSAASVSSPSPFALSASFAFFSVPLLDFLHSLPDIDVGREGSPMRAASLKQCVQLMALLHSCRGELERVEQLLLFGGVESARKGVSRQPIALLLRAAVGSRAATQQHEVDAVRANYLRLAAQLPDEQYGRVFTHPSHAAQPLQQPTLAQQLVMQAVRYLTPSSVRQGLAPLSLQPAPLAAAGRSTAQLLHSSTAFRAQLVAEAQLFDKLNSTATAAFLLPSDPTADTADQHDAPHSSAHDGRQAAARSVDDGALTGSGVDSSAASSSVPSSVRSLSPSRVRSDPYQRLSSSGRQQLARGTALCSKQSAALRFVGGDWERPVANNECAAAVRCLHTLHNAITAATAESTARHSEQGGTGGAEGAGGRPHQAVHALLAQFPLRLLARWDVLAVGLCAWLLFVLVIVALVMA